MQMFQVRLTRNGDDLGTFVLHAFDELGAVAGAKSMAARCEVEGISDNPFSDLDGLRASVTKLS